MVDSILLSIKKLLGIDAEYECFDPDIIVHINTVIASMEQIGIRFAQHVRVTGNSESWSDLLTSEDIMDLVRDYVYLRVRLLFDPPTSTNVMSAIENTAKELEWRLYSHSEISGG